MGFCCESLAFTCTMDRFEAPGAIAFTTIPMIVPVPLTPAVFGWRVAEIIACPCGLSAWFADPHPEQTMAISWFPPDRNPPCCTSSTLITAGLNCGRNGCRAWSLLRGTLLRRPQLGIWRAYFRFAAHLHLRLRAGIQGPQIRAGPFRHADDVRRQYDQDLVIFAIVYVLREEIAQQRQVCQSRPSVECLRVASCYQASEDVRFAFLQTNLVLYLALTDNRLRNPSNWRLPGHGRYFHAQLHTYLVVRMDARCDVYVDAHVLILTLRVHQRVHKSSASRTADADACLKASGSNRHFIADTQLGRLPVHGADFRILNNLRGGII